MDREAPLYTGLRHAIVSVRRRASEAPHLDSDQASDPKSEVLGFDRSPVHLEGGTARSRAV
jgi:hypothetical protein